VDGWDVVVLYVGATGAGVLGMSEEISKPRYRSPSREACSDISLSDFTLDEICKKYEHRARGATHTGADEDQDEPMTIDGADLRRIRALLLCKQPESAVAAMQDLIRDTLGTAL
jgi:uncharacterized protein (DUF849 family)